jgi:hypothetical protein
LFLRLYFAPCWREVVHGLFPRWLRGLLSLACPRESNQREGHPDGWVAFGDFPARLALLRARLTRCSGEIKSDLKSDLISPEQLKQEARFPAKGLRCSAAPTGTGKSKPKAKPKSKTEKQNRKAKPFAAEGRFYNGIVCC